MEDSDLAILREKFGPKDPAYRWHKMAEEIRPIVDGVMGLGKDMKKDTQPKPNTNMVASNTAAPKTQAVKSEMKRRRQSRKERVYWRPEEKEMVLGKVVEQFRGRGMAVPGPGKHYERENGVFLEIVRAAQKETLPENRRKAFYYRQHIEQADLIVPLKERLNTPPSNTPAPVDITAPLSMRHVTSAVDEALAAKNNQSVVVVPIQPEPAKDITTTGKEVRVITIDPNVKEKQHRVWWKSHEMQSVLTLAVNKFKALGVGTVPTKDDYAGSRMMLEVFNSAQHQMLPRERWKHLKSRFQLESAGLLENLQTLLRQAPKQMPMETIVSPTPNTESSGAAVPVAPPPPVAPGPVSPAPLQAAEPVRPSQLPENEIMAALQVLGRAIGSRQELTAEVQELKGMNSLLMEEIDGLRKRIEILDTSVRGLTKEERKVNGHEKAKLPVVAVLGCRKDEFDVIEKKCRERGLQIELRLYEQDTKPRPITADWAIAMKFISHSWFDHMRECTQKGQYTLVRGGVGSMIQQLEIWFGGEQA